MLARSVAARFSVDDSCRSGDIYDRNTVQQILASDSFALRSKQCQATVRLIGDEIDAFRGDGDDCRSMPSFYYFTKNMDVGTRWPK